MVTLGLVTSMSGGGAAVALAHHGTVVASRACGAGRRASEDLLPAIDDVLRTSGLTPDALEAIVVARGPGSFTGIRVGLATAQGLGRALSIPIRGVSSLALLARAAAATDVGAVIPAGRDDWYVGRFRLEPGRTVEHQGSPWLVPSIDVARLVEGVDAVVAEVDEDLPVGRAPAVRVTAEACARLAALSPFDGWCPTDAVEPLYLRRSWAEEVHGSDDRP